MLIADLASGEAPELDQIEALIAKSNEYHRVSHRATRRSMRFVWENARPEQPIACQRFLRRRLP